MRAVVQRVTRAEVRVGPEVVGRIAAGFCVLVGVGREDTEADARYLADRVVGLRVFEDEAGKMNRSLRDHGGSVLAVSQFTLYADTRSGRRPSFTAAASPDPARGLFERFCEEVRALGVTVETGRFRADMAVELVNDGPVTLLLDSTRAF